MKLKNLNTYNSRRAITSLYSFVPAKSLLLGIFEGFTTIISSPSLVLASDKRNFESIRLDIYSGKHRVDFGFRSSPNLKQKVWEGGRGWWGMELSKAW